MFTLKPEKYQSLDGQKTAFAIMNPDGETVVTLTNGMGGNEQLILKNLNEGTLSIEDLNRQILVYARVLCYTSAEWASSPYRA